MFTYRLVKRFNDRTRQDVWCLQDKDGHIAWVSDCPVTWPKWLAANIIHREFVPKNHWHLDLIAL